MTPLALTLTVVLWVAPIVVLAICLYLCIRRRDFFGGPASLACFILLLSLSHLASQHWLSPYKYILITLLAAVYLWLFFIRPFRAGLK